LSSCISSSSAISCSSVQSPRSSSACEAATVSLSAGVASPATGHAPPEATPAARPPSARTWLRMRCARGRAASGGAARRRQDGGLPRDTTQALRKRGHAHAAARSESRRAGRHARAHAPRSGAAMWQLGEIFVCSAR
jgi:hypothetical protein